MTTTPAQVKEVFRKSGISIGAWADDNGLCRQLVYRILTGKARCTRGQSHLIAVLLGLKEGPPKATAADVTRELARLVQARPKRHVAPASSPTSARQEQA